MEMVTHTLVFSMNDLSHILSIDGDVNIGISLTYAIGSVRNLILLEESILLIQFDNGEMRIDLRLHDLLQIKDEQGNPIISGELK